MRLKPLTPPACPCGRLDAKKKPLALPACCGAYLDDFAGSVMRAARNACESAAALYARTDAGGIWTAISFEHQIGVLRNISMRRQLLKIEQ